MSEHSALHTLLAFATLLLLILPACSSGSEMQQSSADTFEWASSSPAAEGLNPSPLDGLHNDIVAGRYGLIDRFVVVRNNKLVVNKHYPQNYDSVSVGHSSALGCGANTCSTAEEESDPYNYLHPSTHPYYQGRAVHSLQSVTKSVASTVVGIAVANGAIKNLDEPLLSFFPDYDLSNVDPRVHDASLEDLLTMRSGIEWHETDRPMDSTNTTLQLEWSDDWIQFTLNQPSDSAPGEKWAYSSGGSHLMSGIVKHATGKFIDEYAEEHLFGPLGIDDYHWKKTPRGYPDTEGGLYLEAEQLAKIGQLYLNGGVWNGQRILSEAYVEKAVAALVHDVYPNGWDYGLQWWRLDRGDTQVWAGLGFGGQFLLILPQHEMVGIVNGWNLYGGSQSGILGPFLSALISSAEG